MKCRLSTMKQARAKFDRVCEEYEALSFRIARAIAAGERDVEAESSVEDLAMKVEDVVDWLEREFPLVWNANAEGFNRKLTALHTLSEQACLPPEERDARYGWL